MKSQKQSAFLLIVDPNFIEDLQYWVKTKAKIASRVSELVEAVRRDPVQGLGKPELIKHLGSGIWSRRITEEHRFVYRVDKGNIYLLRCRYDY